MNARKLAEIPPPQLDAQEKDEVAALGRGLQLLDCFRSAERFLGSQELVERSGLPKATVSRLVRTLVNYGYLEFAEKQGEAKLLLVSFKRAK